MKLHNSVLAICAITVILVGGCGKTDTSPTPTTAPQAQSTQEALSTAAVPAPALPAPIVPPSAEGPDPKPGEAGSHSSPAFKDGGKPDSSK